MNKKSLVRLGLIALGVGIITISIQWFLSPFNIAAGGASGLGIILHSVIGVDVGIVVLIFNVVVLTLAYFLLDFSVFANAVVGSAMLPLFLEIVPEMKVVSDTLFAVIVGSLLFGLGVYILFANSASSGGTTIPPLILKKRFDIDPAISLVITDAIVVGMSLFFLGVESFIYAIFSILITMVTMNFLKAQSKSGRSVMVISEKHEDIRLYITNELNRGVTVLSAQGGFTQHSYPVLMVAIKGKEYTKMIKYIQKIDPKAFMISQNTHNIYGSGFTYARVV